VELTCPRCGNTLRVPDSVQGSRFTCPRCLARLRNPNADRVTSTPSQGQVQPAPRPRSHSPSIEGDTNWDTAATGALLIVLGLVGSIMCVWVVFPRLGTTGSEVTVRITFLVGFLLLLLQAVGGVLAIRGSGPAGLPRSEALGCIRALGIAALLLAAFVIFFFVTCAAILHSI
jgi:hypothetical protein